MNERSRAVTAVFGATIFLGAFLLFQVQLLIGKYILPWYGGVPMVWTICMLCFQVLLLGGYAYAHLVVRRLPEPRQRVLHLVVVVSALGIVGVLAVGWHAPLLPDGSWKPEGDTEPAWHIVHLLAVAVGIPFFAVAPTSPLLQAWFGTAHPSASPYRLYALSNLGSLLGLVTYPTLVETWLPLRAQAWLWTAGFVLFAAGTTACALVTRPMPGVADPSSVTSARAAAPRRADRVFWLALAAGPSLLLLATTNYMSQEVAAFPFLWMLPLALYLVSFIICFERERWYARGPWAVLLVLGVTLSTFVLERGVYVRGLAQIGVPAFALFAACMVCHGELARLKPATAHLTSYYLAITAGGSAGAAIVALGAPAVFPGIWEFPLGLWLAAGLALATFHRDPRSPLRTRPAWVIVTAATASVAIGAYLFRESLPVKLPDIRDGWLFGLPVVVAIAGLVAHAGISRFGRAPVTVPPVRWPGGLATGVACLGLAVVGVALGHLAYGQLRWAVHHSRSFYGMLAVEPTGDRPDDQAFRLRHGRVTHGQQYRADDKRGEPTSYYGRDSGIGLALEHHPRREEGLRVGVVGLGVGTLAAYGRPRDTIRFYEINPEVIRIAGPEAAWFTYVRESPATIEIATGDARLVLERELARGTRRRFDVLAIDAFSSDSIPVHLLTREAVAIYLRHLDAGGVLALHISNRYVELKPVVRGLAVHFGLMYTFVSSNDGELTWRSTWALLARDPTRLAIPPIAAAADTEPAEVTAVLWTDDYSNIVGLLEL